MASIKSKYPRLLLNIFGWVLILGLTFVWSIKSNSEVFNTVGVGLFILSVISLLFIYWVNALILIPRFLFGERRRLFILFNVLLFALMLTKSFNLNDWTILGSFGVDIKRPPPRGFTHFARELLNYILMVGFVTALKLMGRLEMSEEALREAENARIKAELANLRSQINPHFLLNTLNNIYALVAIDPERAQKTIKELSLLLRYVLYDNLSDRVLLNKEVDFLRNYIELMRIRLTQQVRLDVKIHVERDSATEIAPLIFISLIENAFKHGVSADSASFIEITLEDKIPQGEVRLSIRNSNNAKSESDKSGRGVGLDQVQRRLDLLYSGSYEWVVNSDKVCYESTIILKS